MKKLIDEKKDVADEELMQLVKNAELNVKRTIKYDLDAFIALDDELNKQGAECPEADQDELNAEILMMEEDAAIEEAPEQAAEVEAPVESVKTWEQTFEEFEKMQDEFMEKLRRDYKDVTLIECIVYANLIVFSLAATVAFLFYDSPKKYVAPKNSTLISFPVDFENVKVPKKEIKKSFKKVIKEKGDDKKECML